MSETRHSPEPWVAYRYPGDRSWDVHDADPEQVVVAAGLGKEDARRITACVNACVGIPTEALEAGHLAQVIRWFADIVRRDDEMLAAPAYDALRALGVLK
jgi:hypothetical protein